MKGQRKYPVALGKDPLGCIIRLDNSLNNFPERISSVENELATLKQQQAAAQIEVEKPFPQEEELVEKSARLAELNAQLDMDEKATSRNRMRNLAVPRCWRLWKKNLIR